MRFLIVFLFVVFAFAIPALENVYSYPKTYLRDFYLTCYLKKTHSLQEAQKIYNKITYKKKMHLKILSKKFDKFKIIYDCKYPNKNNWEDINQTCLIKNGFRLRDVKNMKPYNVKALLDYLPKSSTKTEIKAIFTGKYQAVFKNADAFYGLFSQIQPDIEIPEIYINNLAKDSRFYDFLNRVVRSYNLPNIQQSLLYVNYLNISDKAKFLLALNAIHLEYFSLAAKILKSQHHKTNEDKFWLYLLTKKQKYADELLNNKRLDFWTLYIYEEFHKKYKIDKVKIYNSAKALYNINKPLDVIKFNIALSKTKNYFAFARKLDNKKTLPLKTEVLDIAYRWSKNYYIMPKYNLKNLTISQKALVYALARQESNFIPAQISHSYAIGVLQLMPFLIKSFHSGYDISQFFKASINLKYAIKHILWLQKLLNNNPLFVAYAYNGGIGFTKRKVLPHFSYKGIFEPFFSIEMVPYNESRIYGMMVVRNYVIYMNLLGKKTTLHQLLKRKIKNNKNLQFGFEK